MSDETNPWLLAAEILEPSAEWKWKDHARENQLPPPGDWFVWVIMAGRGWGKTRTGAEWLAEQARKNPEGEFAVIAPTAKDLRDVCIEGQSGLLHALGLPRDCPEYNRVHGTIELPNGSKIHSFSDQRPDRLRGHNLSGAWCDELGIWKYKETWEEGLMPALRIGDPKVLVTTTPKRTPLLKGLLNRNDGSVAFTRGATFENMKNLSKNAITELKRQYADTRLGRQELYGEMIEDVEGALWVREMFEPRVKWGSEFFDDEIPFRRPAETGGPLALIQGGKAA